MNNQDDPKTSNIDDFPEWVHQASDEDSLNFNKEVLSMKDRHLSVFWGDRMLTIDKSMGFFDDSSFKEAYESIRGNHLYDTYIGPHTIAWRLNTLVWAAKCALKIPGDFVECGVFKGDMAWVITQTMDIRKTDKTFYLYDSFEGFSSKYSSAADYPPEAGGFYEYANNVYKEEGIYQTVKTKFKEMSFVKVIKGFLPESLVQGCPEKISFLHIDLNSPAAEVAVLKKLFDRVVPGGIIVFDDYGWKLFDEQKKAEDEFMRVRGYTILELPTGQGLVFKNMNIQCSGLIDLLMKIVSTKLLRK